MKQIDESVTIINNNKDNRDNEERVVVPALLKKNSVSLKSFFKNFLVLNPSVSLKIESDRVVVEDKLSLKRIIAFLMYKFGNNLDLNFIDVSKLTDFRKVFNGRMRIRVDKNSKEKEIVLNRFNGWIDEWNTISAKSMKSMFKDSVFNRHNLNFDVRNVEEMDSMFENALFDKEINFLNSINLKSATKMFANKKISSKIKINFSQLKQGQKIFKKCYFKDIDLLKDSIFHFQNKNIGIQRIFADIKIDKGNQKHSQKEKQSDEEYFILTKVTKFIEDNFRFFDKNENSMRVLSYEEMANCFVFNFMRNIVKGKIVDGLSEKATIYYLNKILSDNLLCNSFFMKLEKLEKRYTSDLLNERNESLVKEENKIKENDVRNIFFRILSKNNLQSQSIEKTRFLEKYKAWFVTSSGFNCVNNVGNEKEGVIKI